MTALAPHITAFFEQRLPLERGASEHTRDSYAYAFKLFLTYASTCLKVAPSELTVEQMDAPLVVDFLQDLETTRSNSPSSRQTSGWPRSNPSCTSWNIACRQRWSVSGGSSRFPSRKRPPPGNLWVNSERSGRCWFRSSSNTRQDEGVW